MILSCPYFVLFIQGCRVSHRLTFGLFIGVYGESILYAIAFALHVTLALHDADRKLRESGKAIIF